MSLVQAVGLIAYGMGIGVALAAPIGPINIEIIRRGVQYGREAGGWWDSARSLPIPFSPG